MSSCATSQSGSWSSPTTWEGGSVPVSGDVVTLNHAVTLDTSADLGTSTPGQTALTINAPFTIADGAVLRARGNISQSHDITVTCNGAGAVIFDATAANPTSTMWYWYVGNGGTGNGKLVVRGTADKRFCIRAELSGGAACITYLSTNNHNCYVDAEYCDFIHIGDSTTNALTTQLGLTTNTALRLHECKFFNCGQIQAFYVPISSSVDIVNCIWLEPNVGSNQLLYFMTSLGTPDANNVWQITGCDFEGPICIAGNASYPSSAWTISGNTHRTRWQYLATTMPASTPPYPATHLSLTGPVGSAPNVASDPFTVALAPAGTTAVPITVTLSDNGAGGTFSPASVMLSTSSPSATFTYTPAISATITISANSGGVFEFDAYTQLLFVSSNTATSFSLAGPTTSVAGRPSTAFTLAYPASQTLSSPVTFTPTDNGGGGTFTPATVTLTAATKSATFIYTAVHSGLYNISATNDGGLTPPPAVSITAARSFAEAHAQWMVNMTTAPVGADWAQGFYTVYNSTDWPNNPSSQGTFPNFTSSAYVDQTLHYDPPHVYWNVRDITGDSAWDKVVDAALYQFRDLVLFNFSMKSYHAQSTGMLIDYLRTADIRSRDAVYQFTLAPGVVRLSTANALNGPLYNHAFRDNAFALRVYLDTEVLGVVQDQYREAAKGYAMGHLQWCLNQQTTDPGNRFQPFMLGLVMEALIRYWDTYRDSTIPPKIKEFLDFLWTKLGQTNPPTPLCWGSWDSDTSTGNDPTWYTATNTPAPALNQMIAHAYAWYAARIATTLEEKQLYRERYEDAFRGATSTSSGGFYGAKVYNQAYDFDGEGMSWHDQSITPYPAATNYTLTADVTTGRANALENRFVVSLPSQTSVQDPVTVTLSDNGAGGTFVARKSPDQTPCVILTTDNPVGVFRYAPAAAKDGQSITISTTNNGGLTDPAGISYLVSGVAPFATKIQIIAPQTANGPKDWSPAFTVSLYPANSVPPRSFDPMGGTIPIGWDDRYKGGFINTWYQSSVLSAERPSLEMRYLPRGVDTRTLSAFPMSMIPTLPDGTTISFAYDSASYTAATYTLTAPTPLSGPVGSPSGAFTVALPSGAVVSTPVTVTPSDGGAGGQFLPASVALSTTQPIATFTYVPATAETISITTTNDGGMATPPAVTYTARPAPQCHRPRPLILNQQNKVRHRTSRFWARNR